MNYKFHPKLVLRTPLKPLKSSFSINEIKELFSRDEIREALFLSSPDLSVECLKWLNGGYKNKEEETRIIYSLLKYALRLHTRCTPFGLFAGCSVTEWGNDFLLDTENNTRNSSLDMSLTCALAKDLSEKSFIRPYLKFYPNNSIYEVHDNLRYIEYFYKNKTRINQICSADRSVYLQIIIDKTKNGLYLNEVTNLLVSDEISVEEAEDFINEIVEAQLLVSELEPSITGDELLSQIINILSKISREHPNEPLLDVLSVLTDIQDKLAQIDNKNGNLLNAYFDLIKKIELLNIPFEKNKLFQTDLFKKIKKKENDVINELNNDGKNEIQSAITKALQVLNKLSHKPGKTNLTEFKTKFSARYEFQEIPLPQALDNEFGIGYASHTNESGDINPLLKDLNIPSTLTDEKELKWNKTQSFLFDKLLKAHTEGLFIVTIHENELVDWKSEWDDLPVTMSVMFNLVGKRNGKDIIALKSTGGSSATNLFGRFAPGSAEILSLINEIAETEDHYYNKSVLAEIVHIPESRTGNVLYRPIFRQFEIPYLSKSTLPTNKQILVNDLYISIRDNQLYLRSKSLNKQVIPRLGNAHNFSHGTLPIYHFLCDMQLNDLRAGLPFDWGVMKYEFKFLPRVEMGNVILSPATWQLKKDDFNALIQEYQQKESISSLLEKVNEWQDKFKIPDFVLFTEVDNELLINLKDELSIRMFLSIIKNRYNIVLKEFLYDTKTCINDINGDSYANEFIASLIKIQKEMPLVIPTSEIKSLNLQRNFSIGSEWLYYKFYCGVNTSDKILCNIIKPLTEQFIEEGLIDKWFFIRYADPDVHLRIRFHLPKISALGIIISKIKQAVAEYEQTGLIKKTQIDTYQREIERYGESAILPAEDLF
ncbi:MAG: Lantibiotic dehydratase domain protein, partial [Mucilaginibacter sp.]|nr:Lantibiotic dehydratase domain protein [Mucilaginibacter sp.]